MPHHHFSKLHCSNNDIILSNTYGHQTLPLSRYELDVCMKMYDAIVAKRDVTQGGSRKNDIGGANSK